MNQYRNSGSCVKDMKKLCLMAVMKAAEQPEASPYNFRVLAIENFRKYVVEIVYIDTVLDKNRQHRKSRFFVANYRFSKIILEFLGENYILNPLFEMCF